MSAANTIILPPLSAVYSLAMRLRLAAYRRQLFEVTKLDVPVISIGNLTTGGTGKTPLVEWVCRVLAEEGCKVCVLSRGYGRANPAEQLLVSDGKQIFADASRAGDEPLLLARNLLGVAAVVCNARRASAGKWAIENLNSDACVLDDGFQHLQLARDLNVVTVDCTNPWGGGLLPYGHLREPLTGLERADCVVLTRTDQQTAFDDVIETVHKHTQVPILCSRMVTSAIRQLNGVAAPAEKRIAAFCGIGNSEAFFKHLRRDGYEVVWQRAFRDHYEYQQSDVDQIVSAAKRESLSAILTTAKDAVKLSSLRFDLPCYVLEIKIEIENYAELRALIERTLKQFRSNT